MSNKTPLKLDQIVADHAWNARSGNYREASGSEEGGGIGDLAESLAQGGQDHAIDVRPEPSGRRHLIVDGFRRFEATSLLASQKRAIRGLPVGEILCSSRPMTELEARALNVRSGVVRENLKPADLAFGVGKLVELGETSEGIAGIIGKQPAYTRILMLIMSPAHIDQKLTERWRMQGLPLSVNEMASLADVPIGDQPAAFHQLLLGQSRKLMRRRGAGSWIVTSTREAKKLGDWLGTLVREAIVPAALIEDLGDFEDAIRACVPLGGKLGPENAKPEQIAEVARTARDACVEAASARTTTPPVATAGDGEEPKAAGGKRRGLRRSPRRAA